MQGYGTNISKFKKMEIIPNIFSAHNGMKQNLPRQLIRVYWIISRVSQMGKRKEKGKKKYKVWTHIQ